MNEDTAPRRAATAFRRSGLSKHFIVLWAVVLAMAVTVGGVVEAPPAEGATAQRYDRLWNDFSKKRKAWARRTSQCESGGDRNIHGGGGAYHGAFQFSLATWRGAPKSPGGDPHRYSWRTQAVVAVLLKKRDGARRHWPNCG